MKIELRFFAAIREALGVTHETLTLPDHLNTVGAVRELLISRGGPWASALGQEQPLRMAYNQRMTDPQTVIADGGEVAFFPPVTGG